MIDPPLEILKVQLGRWLSFWFELQQEIDRVIQLLQVVKRFHNFRPNRPQSHW